MEFDFSQIKTEFDEGRSGPTFEGNSVQPFRDPQILPTEVLKGHWLEGGVEEEVDPTRETTAEDSSYEINLNSLPDFEGPRPPTTGTTEKPLAETVFHCPSCTYTVDKLLKLRNHQKIHIGAVYRCSYCDFQTNVKRNLARHELNHAPTKRFACDECEYQNNSRVLFNKHKRSHSQHFKNSKFKCPICEFGSAERESWKRHILSHERLRLHECRRCDYVTTKLSDIKRHNLTHAKSDASSFPGVQCTKCSLSNTTTTTSAPAASIATTTPHLHHRQELTPHHHHVDQLKIQPQHHLPLLSHHPSEQLKIQQHPQQTFHCLRCQFETQDHNTYLAHTLSHGGTKAIECSTDCDCKTNFKNRLKEGHPKAEQERLEDGLSEVSKFNFDPKYKLDPITHQAVDCHPNS